ncbi:hypothetical protein [Nakamurella leprariae]|uniref:Lipoprotein n=1 Tax=Nakamurella leprariae TaxID=2803911 RepID=A0A938YEP4_9ACTN|nr:hypothetical protein [Nakamurella leprariae]MBM9467047.1 hypothetical protein [Nakamurella leprariae]
MSAGAGLAVGMAAFGLLLAGCGGSSQSDADPGPGVVEREYPWHTDIVATTFWVGEIFDPDAEDGSQVLSTYDDRWMEHYGGCDGVVVDGDCRTEPRTADRDFFPTAMTPRENPFYLDVPFDDLNDERGSASRGEVVPWAGDPGWAELVDDPGASLMKNRWVQLRRGDRECYGQVQDAGPGEYADTAYVFGDEDARPANARYGGAGMDVSPALNGCLEFADLDGDTDRLDWRFVQEQDVPDGPWRILVTTSGVTRE